MKDELLEQLPWLARLYTAWRMLTTTYKKLIEWWHRPPRRVLKLSPDERMRQALHHLKTAKDYHDKYYALEQDRDKENYQRFMAQHIIKARQYDPKAELTLEEKGKEDIWTIERFSA